MFYIYTKHNISIFRQERARKLLLNLYMIHMKGKNAIPMSLNLILIL